MKGGRNEKTGKQTGDRKIATWKSRQEIGDKRVATWKGRQETGDRSEKTGKQTGDWERKHEIRLKNREA
jgi:hypothetical protein